MSISTSADFGITTLKQPSGDGVCQSGKRIGVRGVRQEMTAAEKRQAIDRATRAVERAFLNWHFTGDFGAAATYTEARNTWALMLMKWGQV